MSDTTPKPSLLQMYQNAEWIRLAVQSIPRVGGALDLLLTSTHQRLARERLNYLLAGLEHDVRQIADDQVDYAFLDSEEFHDLVLQAFAASVRSRERAKIRLHARVLAGAIRADRPVGDESGTPETHLELLSNLNIRDLVVLRAIVHQQGLNEPPDGNVLIWARGMGWDKLPEIARRAGIVDVAYHLHRLEREGCIREISGTYFDYLGGVFLLSDATRSLIRWLERSGGFPTEADVERAQQPDAD
jgi:hypothetical protein